MGPFKLENNVRNFELLSGLRFVIAQNPEGGLPIKWGRQILKKIMFNNLGLLEKAKNSAGLETLFLFN